MNNNFNEIRDLLNLQRSYENKEILESDIINQDKKKLLDLYNSQILTLKMDVKRKQQELNKITEWVNKKYELAIEKLS